MNLKNVLKLFVNNTVISRRMGSSSHELKLAVLLFQSELFTNLSLALQSFVGPWSLFQFLNPIHNR
jgi:hypothetical protein